MAVATVGAFVVQTSSTTQQPQVDTFGTLKTCVAKTLGADSDPYIKQLAGDGILRAIDDINMRHFFQFGSKKASDVNLTASTDTYALQSDFFAVRDVQLIDTDGDEYRTLRYVDYDFFNMAEEQQDVTGTPVYWTVHNSFDDGQIIVYPTPEASDATDYDLRIIYYERVPRVSADGDIIDAPRELSDILCTYAEYHVLFVRERENERAWTHKLAFYRDKLQAFKSRTLDQPSEAFQLRVKRRGAKLAPGKAEYDPLS